MIFELCQDYPECNIELEISGQLKIAKKSFKLNTHPTLELGKNKSSQKTHGFGQMVSITKKKKKIFFVELQK